MNILSIYQDWGIVGHNDLMISISVRNRFCKTALQKFHRYLCKAYKPGKQQEVLSEYSPVLASSMLEFLSSVDRSAEYLVEMIEYEIQE